MRRDGLRTFPRSLDQKETHTHTHTHTHIYICRDALSLTFIVFVNRLGDSSSNPR